MILKNLYFFFIILGKYKLKKFYAKKKKQAKMSIVNIKYYVSEKLIFMY